MSRVLRSKPRNVQTIRRIIALALVLPVFFPIHGSQALSGEREKTALIEEFNDLSRWKPLKFKKIDKMSSYEIVGLEGGGSALKASSSDSASSLMWSGEYNVYDYPMIRWRWKISNIYLRGNALVKEGDDYPLRVCIMFKYDPLDPHVHKALKYSLAKLFYGDYPPYTSLNYIWANRDHERPFITSAYAKEAIMVPVRSGRALAGQWLNEERNVLQDYRDSFGKDPPRMAGLVIINDSDDTGESSVSWIDRIEIFRVSEDPGTTEP